MPEAILCFECGADLPVSQPRGLCPRCALEGALEMSNGESQVLQPEESFGKSCCSPAKTIVLLPALKEFGDYELFEQLGRGGMGVVYRARQRSLNRLVAVKMLLNAALSSPAMVRRFEMEAETVASLDHPHIVPIFEVGEVEAQRYFSMRLVEGESLAEQIAGRKFVPGPAGRSGDHSRSAQSQERIARLMVTVARAVHYAHTQGVLHRDLKPGNILIDRAGEPHLTDFGLAKTNLDGSLTDSGTLLGTPAYMAPELASGRPATAAADVYSLGVVLYELLTGRPPFRGATPIETLRRVTDEEPSPPALLNLHIDHDLSVICLKALEKDPLRRYGSAAELADDLGRWLRHEPVSARRAGPLFRGARWARRNRAAAGLIAVLLVALGVLSGLLEVLNDRRHSDLEAAASIRAIVVRNLDELLQRPDKISERIGAEELAALAGKRKSYPPPGALRLKVGLGATEAAADRATLYQPMLDFMERRMERLLGRPVRLDLVLSKEVRLDKSVARDGLDLARIGALAFIRARQANPSLVALAQENVPKDALIFALTRSGITNLSQVRSIAFADTNSTISAWAKVLLARAGVTASTLHHYANLPGRFSDDYAHREAVKAVLEGRFDAGVARQTHLIAEVGIEGRDWVALRRFESSQTLWAGGGSLSREVREALATALTELTSQQHLMLPDRVRNLVPFNAKSLDELEQALERDLDLFHGVPGGKSGKKAP